MLGYMATKRGVLVSDVIQDVFLHLQFNIVYGLSNYQNLQMGDYKYPLWANVVGWALSLTSMLAIPVVAVYQLCITPGTLFEVCHTKSNSCRDYLD
ncbi:hypothetical protein AHF37_01972 [Paragonimus kellicotti]|nr:hypothetical protein AHF37_01972 [Paragonimus kellicotti]